MPKAARKIQANKITLAACCLCALSLFSLADQRARVPCFCQPAWAQSTSSAEPTILDSTQIEGSAEPNGQSYYYSFTAGPGDLLLSMSGETDFYTTNTHLILFDDKGIELSNLALHASGDSTTTQAHLHLTRQQKIRMQIMFGVDVGVHVNYKINLKGALAIAAPANTLASTNTGTNIIANNSTKNSAKNNAADNNADGSMSVSRAQPNQTNAPKITQTNPQTITETNPQTNPQTITQTNLQTNPQTNLASADFNSYHPQAPDGTNIASAIATPIEDKWAFLVGISKFAKPTINLRYSAKDAKDLASYLVSDANFAPDHVKILTDEQATKERILADLGDKWLPRLAHPNDLVLIFISTHGSPSNADLEGINYLVTHNTDPESLFATGLPLSDLAAVIKHRVHSNRVVLIIDACHSGAAETAKGLSRIGNVDSDSLLQGTGQLIICSSQPNQVSWESKRYPNGVFTRKLIEALQTEKGKATLSQVFARMKESIQDEVLQDRRELQTPVLKSNWSGNDVILTLPPTKHRPLPTDLIESLQK